jgi:hypothetical protein
MRRLDAARNGTRKAQVLLDPYQRARLKDLGGSAWLQGVLDSMALTQVRAAYPEAIARQLADGSWHIESGTVPGEVLGLGDSAGAAWHVAAQAIAQRPIQ